MFCFSQTSSDFVKVQDVNFEDSRNSDEVNAANAGGGGGGGGGGGSGGTPSGGGGGGSNNRGGFFKHSLFVYITFQPTKGLCELNCSTLSPPLV